MITAVPLGISPGKENMVCKLKKVSYRLKLVGREWQNTLTAVFTKKLRFKHLAVNHSIFFRHRKEEYTIIVVMTNDMAVTSKHASDISKFKSEIQKYFSISDGGEL